MAKIMGNIVGLPSPRSDWNQTDETKADYIKNKPLKEIASIGSLHYYGDKNIVPNVSVEWRTLYDDVGWMLYDVVDIVQLDNFSSYENTIILPPQSRSLFTQMQGKFLKRDGSDADGSNITKVIVPRKDADEWDDVYKDTFDPYFPNLEEFVETGDAATKGYVDEKIGDIDTALEELHNYAQALIGGAE